MNRSFRRTLSAAVCGAILFGNAVQARADDPPAPTHEEVAKLLVELNGLSRYLSESPTAQEYFALLQANGVSPQDGWNQGTAISEGDLARVIVQSRSQADEIEDPDDPQSWIDYVREQGIPIDPFPSAVIPMKSAAQTTSMSRGFSGDSGSGWDTSSGLRVRGSKVGNNEQAKRTIDGSGISEDGARHSSAQPAETMHIIEPVTDPPPSEAPVPRERFSGTPNGPWLEFKLSDGPVSLAEMHIWNYGEGDFPDFGSLGMKEVEILYTTIAGETVEDAVLWGSDDPADWHSAGTYTLNPDTSGPGPVDFEVTDEIPLFGVPAQYILIVGATEPSDWNYVVDAGASPNFNAGLSEVRFYPVVPEPSSAMLLMIGMMAMFWRRRAAG